MRAFKFLKYDLRKCKYLLLFSIVIFAPLSLLMGYNANNEISIFSYMMLVVMISVASLFSQEQKTDCGFEFLLPASEADRVKGRFMTGVAFIVWNSIIACVVCAIYRIAVEKTVFHERLIATEQTKLFGVPEMILFFISFGLIYVSIINTLLYLMGREISPQVRNVIVIIPAIGIWGIINAFIVIISVGETLEVLKYISSHLTLIGICCLAISIIVYWVGIVVSTRIAEKKDFR